MKFTCTADVIEQLSKLGEVRSACLCRTGIPDSARCPRLGTDVLLAVRRLEGQSIKGGVLMRGVRGRSGKE